MNVTDWIGIGGICFTILGCTWYLSNQMTSMDERIKNIGRALDEHKEDDKEYQKRAGERFNEVFNQIRSVMLMKVER